MNHFPSEINGFEKSKLPVAVANHEEVLILRVKTEGSSAVAKALDRVLDLTRLCTNIDHDDASISWTTVSKIQSLRTLTKRQYGERTL